MKIIDVSILENPIVCKWRSFPGDNILTDPKHWKIIAVIKIMIFREIEIKSPGDYYKLNVTVIFSKSFIDW